MLVLLSHTARARGVRFSRWVTCKDSLQVGSDNKVKAPYVGRVLSVVTRRVRVCRTEAGKFWRLSLFRLTYSVAWVVYS
jgi:hypothetical protein